MSTLASHSATAIAATTHLNSSIINTLKTRQSNVAESQAMKFAQKKNYAEKWFLQLFREEKTKNPNLYNLLYSVLFGVDVYNQIDNNTNTTPLNLATQLNYFQIIQNKYFNNTTAVKSDHPNATNYTISEQEKFNLFQVLIHSLLATSGSSIEISKSLTNFICFLLKNTADANNEEGISAAKFTIQYTFFQHLKIHLDTEKGLPIANSTLFGETFNYDNFVWFLEFILTQNYLTTVLIQLLSDTDNCEQYFTLFFEWVSFHLNKQIKMNNVVNSTKTASNNNNVAIANPADSLDEKMNEIDSKNQDSMNLFGSNQSCKEILRLFITTTLKVRVPFAAFCDTINKNSRKNKASLDVVNTLLHSLCSILIDSSCYHKDALTQAGFIIGLFIQPHSNSTVQIQDIPYLLYKWRTILKLNHTTSEEYSNEIIFSTIHSSLQINLTPIAYLSLYRSLLSHGATQFSAFFAESTLLFQLFPLITHYCESSNPHLRFYSFQTLEIWLNQLKQLIQIQENHSFTVENSKFIEFYLNRILELLQPNFEHPFRVIVISVKQIFDSFIQVQNLLQIKLEKKEEEKKKENWSKFLKDLLGNLNETVINNAVKQYRLSEEYISSRPIYHQLLCLLPNINNKQILSSNPFILAILFSAAQHRTVFGLANQTLIELLKNLKHEMKLEYELTQNNNSNSIENNQKTKKKQRHQRLKDPKKQKEIEMKQEEAVNSLDTLENEPIYLSEWRKLWLIPLLSCLFHDSELVRSQVASSTLHWLLSNDGDQLLNRGNLAQILQFLSQFSLNPQNSLLIPSQNQFRALILILKTARKNGLISTKEIESSLLYSKTNSVNCIAGMNRIPLNYQNYYNSLLSSDSSFRLDCLELLCSNSLRAELAANIELQLFQEIFPLIIKINSSIPNIRTRFIHLIQRFLLRIRDSVNRAIKDDLVAMNRNVTMEEIKEFKRNQHSNKSGFEYFLSPAMQTRLNSSVRFVHWLENYLMASLYPGSPFERTSVTLELYQLNIQLFTSIPNTNSSEQSLSHELEQLIWGLQNKFFTQSRVDILLNCFVCGWEKVRLSSYTALSLFPPQYSLPGYSNITDLQILIRWAYSLISSYRVRDSDAGALLFKLIANKYSKQLKWKIPLRQILTTQSNKELELIEYANTSHEAQLYLMNEFSSILTDSVQNFIPRALGTLNTPTQPQQSSDSSLLTTNFHGFLLSMRYILQGCELVKNFNTVFSAEERLLWQEFGEKLIQIQVEIAKQSLQLQKQTNRKDTVKEDIEEQQDEENEAEEEEEEDEAGEEEEQLDLTFDCRGHIILPHENQGTSTDNKTPVNSVFSTQLLVVSLWLGVKEVSLILGTAVELSPLPTTKESNDGLFNYNQLLRIGELYFSILLSSKHNGVLEKSHIGFGLVCRRLLYSNHIFLHELVEFWLAQLLAKIQSTSTDLWIRRSRGVVFAFMAILKGELPSNNTKHAVNQNGNSILRQNKYLFHSTIPKLIHEAHLALNSTVNNTSLSWKYIVHALNILRSIYRDSELNLDGMAYCNEAFQLAILGFSHSEWAVRNSSLLMFGALLIKALRLQYLNQASSSLTHNLNRSLTGLELFSQLPGFQLFLQKQLEQAVTTENRAMHPSLYPILLLLSKLTAAQAEKHPLEYEPLLTNPYKYIQTQFSSENSASTNTNSMYVFLPYVLRCLSHRVYMARFMASKAIVSLIPIQEQELFILAIINALPKTTQILESKHCIHHNAVHGALLAIQELFSCLSKPDSPASQIARSEFLFSAYSALFNQSVWLLSRYNSNSILKVLAFEICFYLLQQYKSLVTQMFDGEIQHNLFHQFTSQLFYYALQACEIDSNPKNFMGIGIDSLRTTCATYFLQELLEIQSTASMNFTHKFLPESTRNEVSNILGEFLSDPSLSFRETTLKAIRSAINQEMANNNTSIISLNSPAKQFLFSFHSAECCFVSLYRCFTFPDSSAQLNITCQRLILQIFVKLLSINSVNNQLEQASIVYSQLISEEFWNLLQKNIFSHENIDIGLKSQAIVLVGIIIRELIFNSSTEDSQVLNNRLNVWFKLLENYSKEDYPAGLRQSCAKSIHSSLILLKPSHNSVISVDSALIFPLWPILMCLLQDHSEVIRIQTSNYVELLIQAMQHHNNISNNQISNNNSLIVSCILESLYSKLFSTLGSHQNPVRFELIQFLFQLLLDSCNISLLFTADSQRPEQLKLFRKEKSNESAEELLILQLNIKTLHQILNINTHSENIRNNEKEIHYFQSIYSTLGRSLIEYVTRLEQEKLLVANSQFNTGNTIYSFEMFLCLYSIASGLIILHIYLTKNNAIIPLSSAELVGKIEKLSVLSVHPTLMHELNKLQTILQSNNNKVVMELDSVFQNVLISNNNTNVAQRK